MEPEENLTIDIAEILCPGKMFGEVYKEQREKVTELIRKVKKEWCIEFAEFCTGIKREFIENGYEKFLTAPEPE